METIQSEVPTLSGPSSLLPTSIALRHPESSIQHPVSTETPRDPSSFHACGDSPTPHRRPALRAAVALHPAPSSPDSRVSSVPPSASCLLLLLCPPRGFCVSSTRDSRGALGLGIEDKHPATGAFTCCRSLTDTSNTISHTRFADSLGVQISDRHLESSTILNSTVLFYDL